MSKIRLSVDLFLLKYVIEKIMNPMKSIRNE